MTGFGTATVSKGKITKSKEFTSTIPALEATPQDIIDKVKEKVTYKSILNNNSSENNVTTDLNLTFTIDDVNIIWISSDTTVVENNGSVHLSKEIKNIQLNAIFTTLGSEGDVIEDKEPKVFNLTIPAQELTRLEEAKEALDFEDIKGENGKDDQHNITKDLELVTSLDGFDGVLISWESDKSTIIAKDGTVTTGRSDENVTLIATLSKDGKEETKEFEVVVVVPQRR